MTTHLTVKLNEDWGRHRKGQTLRLPEPTAQTLARKNIAQILVDKSATVVAKVMRKSVANK